MRLINEAIHYIGADDPNLDLFESQYALPEGMAYNSYLIQDEIIAILDTIDARCADAWKGNLQTALGERQPDYLVVHHMEPDHSGLIAWALEQYPALQIVASARAISMLEQFFEQLPLEGRTRTIQEGDVLPLGKHTLRFFSAAMVHWPEVMVSYEETSGILFSADAFGKFGALASCGFWGDEDTDWACEARRYYFNICGKYGTPVQNLLKKMQALPLRMIAPLHGPILRQDLDTYLRLYNIWSRYDVESEGVFIACASIHGGTLEAAQALAEMLREKGCPKVALTDLTRDDPAEAVEDAFRYGKLILCAATYDGGLFPPAQHFLLHLRDKAWQKRRVGLVENGSWAPAAARVMKSLLSEMKDIEIVEPVVSLRSRMKAADRCALEQMADAILAK